MLRVGGTYRYQVGSYVLPTEFRVESHNGTHWVARSLDSFEAEVYADDSGRHVGSRDLGMYDEEVNVFFVIGDDNETRSRQDLSARN